MARAGAWSPLIALKKESTCLLAMLWFVLTSSTNVKSHVQGSGRCRARGGGLVLYFENDPDELEHQAQKVQRVAQEETSLEFPSIRHEPLHSSTDPCSGAEISEENCVKIFNDYAAGHAPVVLVFFCRWKSHHWMQ